MKWLHLSDLHIIKKVNWEVFIKDLLQRCEERGKIDLVIVTGDFHEFKEKDDFSKAKIFLIDLIEKLKLDITKDLFLIPGDHDGSNPICDHKDGNIAVLKKDVTRINGKEWNELLEQFESYENFVKELIPKYPFEHPAGEHCRTWNDKITFIHCNSAVVSDLIDEKEQLLNIDTFANLAMESRLPSIVLMHNHISDIHKEQVGQIKGIIRNSKIKAFFCGAHHKQQMDMINVSDKQNCQIPCVGCYKSAPDAEDRYSTCGVIIGTWINEKATLEGWTWKVDRSFKLDNIISGQTIEMGEKYYNEALDVLGIPVILYLALMANIDIGKNPTKPELYYRIFAEKGGIFDKFYKKGIEYDSGRQILRNSKNIKNYLNVLRDIAFKMFEKKSLILSVEECTIPKLEFESNKVNILEFPIKYLFENSETKIEFIHRSIYEFFVANKLLESFQSADKISKYELANVFGKNLSKNVLSKEILEFMNYKINELISFENIEETFQLMLDYGMTYFTKSKTKNILESEQIIFANMLEIIHIYGKSDFDFRNLVIYIKCNKNMALNLEEIRMQDEDLRGANFQDSNLMNAKINYSDLRGINGRNVYAPKIELNGTDLRGADLKNAKLQCAKLYNAKLQVTDFSGANLEGAHLEYANLRGAILKGAILKGANLEGANLEGINLEGVDISVAKIGETIFDEEQIEILKKDIELLHWKVLVHTTNGLVNYEEYFNASVYPQVSQCH